MTKVRRSRLGLLQTSYVVPPGWRSTGWEALSWYNVSNDVTLDGGALVKQRLEYRLFVVGGDEFTWRATGTNITWSSSSRRGRETQKQ